MLVNFTFGNFRSFREEKTLSLEAMPIEELGHITIKAHGTELLPVAVIYGANSSGKSNVLGALLLMTQLVLGSIKLNPDDELRYDPFALSAEPGEHGTSFEIQFYHEETLYRYGFAYRSERITQEWLFSRDIDTEEEIQLFDRELDEIEVMPPFAEGQGKESFTASNRLFVSLVAQMNGAISQRILSWFRRASFLSGLESERYEPYTLTMLMQQLEGHEELSDFFQRMQLGFDSIVVQEQAFSSALLDRSIPSSLRASLAEELRDKSSLEAFTVHRVYNDDGTVAELRQFAKDAMESEGTKKVIEISGSIFDALHHGRMLVVDELDAKLHPILTRNIIQLFTNPKTNPRGAQLICATHDTHLLDLDILRRDQIWFTEKDRTEASDLYSLVEFRHVVPTGETNRPHPTIEQDYINGRYGAIPFLSNAPTMWYTPEVDLDSED